MNITVNPDLSSHIVSADNLQECFLPNYNPETLIPFTTEEQVLAFCENKLTPNYFVPYKSPEDREAEKQAALALNNSSRAKMELQASDWSDLPSVRNTEVTPHLVNTQAFDTYRAQLRAIVVNKPTTVDTWPECPQAQWSAL